jgi:DNA-binding MarR family transcriptional regulator
MADKADSYLKPLGINAADRAILEFLYPDNALTVPEVAKRYNVSRQHVQVTVNPLLEAGLLKQQPNPAHKRSPHIVLTAAGRKLFDRIRKADQRAIEALFADVSVTGQQQTRATLTTLLKRLDTQGEAS